MKTVTPAAGRPGADAVDEKKAGRLRALAAALDPPAERVDIVEVSLDVEVVGVRWLKWT